MGLVSIPQQCIGYRVGDERSSRGGRSPGWDFDGPRVDGYNRPMRRTLVLHLPEDRGALLEVGASEVWFAFFDPEDLRGPWGLRVRRRQAPPEDRLTGTLEGPNHRVHYDLRVIPTHPRTLGAWTLSLARVEGVLEVDGEAFAFRQEVHRMQEGPERPGMYVSVFVHRFERDRPGSFAGVVVPRRGVFGTRYQAHLSWHTPEFHMQEGGGRHHLRPFRWRYVVQDSHAHTYDVEVWAPERHVMEMATPEGYRYLSVIAHGFFTRLEGETPTHRYYARHTVFLDILTPRRIPLASHEHLGFGP